MEHPGIPSTVVQRNAPALEVFLGWVALEGCEAHQKSLLRRATIDLKTEKLRQTEL